MASKLEQAVKYVESLQIGSKLSIKSLAKDLAISEGTAYHAIKRAEQLGFVVTLPKAGTTRIRKKQNLQDIALTIASVKSLVGAENLTDVISEEHTVNDIYLGNDSEPAALHALEKSGKKTLCIVGDRREIQEIAITCGANLLLVNHAQISDALLHKAVENGCVVLRTRWSSPYVIGCLVHDTKVFTQNLADLTISQWMRPPQFLYVDDLVADGIGIFKDYGLRKIPVVDHEKTICGFLRIEAAFDADRSQRISRVYDPGDLQQTISTSTAMKEVVSLFLSGQDFYLPVVEDNKLVGIVYCSDILDFAIQGKKTENSFPRLPYLSVPEDEGLEKRCIYTAKMNKETPELQDIHSALKTVMQLAVTEYCRKNLIHGMELYSDYHLMSESPLPEELFVSVEESIQSNALCVISCEAYDDRSSYGQYHMTIRT